MENLPFIPVWFFHALAFQGEFLRKLIKQHPDSFLAASRCLYINLPRWQGQLPYVEVSSQWIPKDVLLGMADTIKMLVVHAPYIDGDKKKVKNSEFIDITTYSKTTVKRLQEYINSLKILHPRSRLLIVMHPLPVEAVYGRKRLLKNIARVFNDLIPVLQETNTLIGIENMPWFRKHHAKYTQMLGQPEFFEELFSMVDSRHIGMTFDFGHANSVARYLYNNKQLSLQRLKEFYFQSEFFSRLGSKIYHIHFSFNPAHRPHSRPLVTWLPKFRNFDTHEPIDRFDTEEIEQLKSVFSILWKSKPHVPGWTRTLTLELIPRSLNMIRAYEHNVNLLRDWFSVLQ